MQKYRGIIEHVMETLNEISVKGGKDCQRMYTALYALEAVCHEMEADQERALEKKAAEGGVEDGHED